MLEAVADPNGRGTARSLFKDRPYRVAGKTGTARIAGPNGYDGKYRASFAGYFPADAPEYSCIVVIAEPASGAYYGSVIAAPVFQELADKALGTDPRFHKSSTGPLAANPKLPTSQGGSAAGLVHLLESFGIPYESAGSGPYVHAAADSVRTVLTPARLQAGVVPDVRGMGLRDALFLLENAGIQVRATGVGTVRNQSVPPGTALSGCRSILLQLS
jgi:cell division protein FtsI (penicillin-binding protein 3)